MFSLPLTCFWNPLYAGRLLAVQQFLGLLECVSALTSLATEVFWSCPKGSELGEASNCSRKSNSRLQAKKLQLNRRSSRPSTMIQNCENTFPDRVAGPIVNKLFECGFVPNDGLMSGKKAVLCV
jgi:hypothetical protein